MNFNDFDLDPALLDAIHSMGYEEATPVQERVIPLILEGKDVIASAQTGTGKTAAFLLPLINKLIHETHHDHVKSLVIVPTRELAVQITHNMEGLSYFTPVSSIAIYGGSDGMSFEREKHALKSGVDMVVCTPGRMLAHINMNYFDMKQLKYLVLDEADRMLDMGFVDDIMRIISNVPKQRQTMLFSATMPHKIRDLARKILHHPVEINISLSKPPEKIVQEAFVVYESQKIPLVKYLLQSRDFKSVLVFCSTKQSVKSLSRELQRSGFSVDEIHSDLDQPTRERVLLNFKNRSLKILVATDVLSRGIDIEDIDLVINYDVPHDGEDYVHRIGRTARAETDGIAYTLINENEQRKFGVIEHLLGHEVKKMPIPQRFGNAPEYNPSAKRNPAPKKRFARKKRH